MKHIIGYSLAVLPLYGASQAEGWLSIPLIMISIWIFVIVMTSDWFNK